mgnify:CR=1 FL=1
MEYNVPFIELYKIAKKIRGRMMAEAREITKIEPLNGQNCPTWKYNIKLVLMERRLWGFVSGTEEQPGEDATAQVVNAYRLKSDKAYSLIALSVNKNIQVHISTTTDQIIR